MSGQDFAGSSGPLMFSHDECHIDGGERGIPMPTLSPELHSLLVRFLIFVATEVLLALFS